MFIPYKIEEDRALPGKPILVYGFSITYVVAYIVLFHVLSEFTREDIFYRFGCVPTVFRWWTPITCTFLHGGLMHVAGNVYFFWIYGRSCEKALGTVKFLLLYLFGAYVSVLVHVLTVPRFFADVPTIGASGAISAVLGAFLVIFPTVKIRFLVMSLAFSRPLPTRGPAYLVLGGWFLVQIAYGLQIVGQVMGVAFWAHIAGFAAGAVVGSVYLILHHWSVNREEARQRDSLLDAWKRYREGDAARAAACLDNFEAEESHPSLPLRWRLLNGFLLERVANDKEAASQMLVGQIAESKENADYGGMLQSYLLLKRRFQEYELPGWLHRDGATAASRVDQPAIALRAFLDSILAGFEEKIPNLLIGIRTSLVKLGQPAAAEAVKEILNRRFPDYRVD